MPGRGASRAAARDLNGMAEKILAPRMLPEPLPENPCQERGERGTPAGPPPLLPFHFADQDRLSLEVDVIDPRSHDLRAAGTGMGGEADHRIDPGVPGGCLDVLQKFCEVGQGEEQALPELVPFLLRQAAAADLPLDLVTRLEGRLLVCLGIDEAVI